MFLNISLGFILPWIVAFFLIKKDRKLLVLIAPCGSVIASTFDLLGKGFGFWKVTPFSLELMNAIPMYLGIYPVLATYMIFFINRKKWPRLVGILGFTLFTTILEGLGVVFGKVHYYNDWNIGWTFISYLIPFILVYFYYSYLKRLRLI
ncbi:hypothetical protein J2S11_001191 [Bacillus horti]|uniref:Uncharacterized protein n=1 Tax=Caldalkalibacillus horti TaxID=77523 RepID=A0ABT9VWB8_9BACI|nr:hypothetical protein [Bacillus horti]